MNLMVQISWQVTITYKQWYEPYAPCSVEYNPTLALLSEIELGVETVTSVSCRPLMVIYLTFDSKALEFPQRN